ncbi:MAG: hypothetical protein QOD56_1556 [Gammaproteobacteria bacterium]|nr:hypothetical protein [Gammaproteobacteria bacterium]
MCPVQRRGWVELFVKPIGFALQLMGIASLHPSYALRLGAPSG